MATTLPLPGFVNSHCHRFQRALRGRAAGADFGRWRGGMLMAADGRIGAYPMTASDFGDGFLRVSAVRERGTPLCIGSDSGARIDPLEDPRKLEGIARWQSGSHGIISKADLPATVSSEGANSLQVSRWEPMQVDLAQTSLAGVAREHVPAALIAGCSSDVIGTELP